MKLSIFATDLNSAIGNSARENGLPWEDISEDFKHFREVTKLYKYVVMGRTTWEAIFKKLGKPLPGRENIILSTTMIDPPHSDVKIFTTVKEILGYLEGKDFCVIGGAKTYEVFAPFVDIMVITTVHERYPADCWFNYGNLLKDFYEDKGEEKVLRVISETGPLVTVRVYKRYPKK